MTEKSALRITELDFDSIKNNLKTFLRSQDEFQDFDFEGAGMSVLLDILAYNTFYQSFYLNMVANETFLDSSQLRSSVLSHAKLVNYVPASKQGSQARINIRATPSPTEDNDINVITLERYTRLLGQDLDGVNYPFVALNSNTASKSSGSFYWDNVTIKQGEVITLQYLMDSTNESRRFEIPSDSVDTTTILMRVQESSTNTTTQTYTLAEDITEITANSAVYFIEENENLQYTFYFGDGYIGKKPKNGNVIICTYIDTAGAAANNISEFTFIDPIGGKFSDNVTVTTVAATHSGLEKEDLETVKFRAPYFYSTQNRAVIDTDYETLILKDYNNIDSVSVWGGEDNDPVVYGKVFISLKTRGNYFLTNFEKERIKSELISNRSIMTVTPEIVDPDYIYFLISGTVYYDATLTTKTANEIQALVRAAIQDYATAELSSFRSTFRKSALQRYIEAADTSITGSDIDVLLQKRIAIDPNNTRTYTANFNTPLQKTITGTKFYTYPEIEQYDSAGVIRKVFFEETPDAATGIDSIEITNSGRNYLTAPAVTIIGDGSGATAEATVVSGRIDRITVTNAGSDYSSAVVSIAASDTGSEAAATAVLQANIGVIRSFYYSSSREKIIVNANAGTINYATGKIVLNSLATYDVVANDFYDTDILTVNILADNENIYTLRNNILAIDENDPRSIQISVSAET